MTLPRPDHQLPPSPAQPDLALGSREPVSLLALSRTFAQEDVARSWRHTLVAISLLALAVVLAAAATLPIELRALASIAAALFIVRLFAIYHDHLHGALLRRSPAAEFLFRIFGLLVLSPVSVWKESHSHHHHHTNQLLGSQIGSFPVMTTEQWRSASPRVRLRYWITRHPLNILLGGYTVFGFGMSLAPFLRDPRRHFEGLLALALRALLALALIRYAGVATWLLALEIPFLVSTAIGSYLFYAQHCFPGSLIQPRSGWNKAKAALESSSYLKMNPFLAWCTGNIGYHHVHHLNEAIPFYRLPEAMAAIPELRSPRVTSLRPRDVAACLKLALWDSGSRRLVEYPR